MYDQGPGSGLGMNQNDQTTPSNTVQRKPDNVVMPQRTTSKNELLLSNVSDHNKKEEQYEENHYVNDSGRDSYMNAPMDMGYGNEEVPYNDDSLDYNMDHSGAF